MWTVHILQPYSPVKPHHAEFHCVSQKIQLLLCQVVLLYISPHFVRHRLQGVWTPAQDKPETCWTCKKRCVLFSGNWVEGRIDEAYVALCRCAACVCVSSICSRNDCETTWRLYQPSTATCLCQQVDSYSYMWVSWGWHCIVTITQETIPSHPPLR